MHLIVKDGNYRANLFSDLAYFMSEGDVELFGRTDYSLRLVQFDNGLFIAHPGATEFTPSGLVHQVDLQLIKDALATRDFVLVGGYKEGTTLFTNSILGNIKYLTRGLTDPTRVIDLLTQEYVDLKGPVSALMFVTQLKGLDSYIAYLDPLFLKTGSLFKPSSDFTIQEIYERPGYILDTVVKPIVRGGHLVHDVVLATSEVTVDILPDYKDDVVEAFIRSNCHVESNLPVQVIGRTFSISSRSTGYFKLTCDFGLVSKLKSEKCNLDLVVRNIGGAFL